MKCRVTRGKSNRDRKFTKKAIPGSNLLDKKDKLPRNNIEEHTNKTRYLLVDGYNIIFSWKELREMAKTNINDAKNHLTQTLANFGGFTGETVILVFDAHKVKSGIENTTKQYGIYIVHTKEAETADNYIEKLVADIKPDYNVRVATSDFMEQIITIAKGATRLSADDLKYEISLFENDIKDKYLGKKQIKSNTLLENLTPDLYEWFDDMRKK